MGVDWYFSKGGYRGGPVPVEVLRQMVASGALQGTDFVWTGGWPDWQSVAAAAAWVPGGLPVAAIATVAPEYAAAESGPLDSLAAAAQQSGSAGVSYGSRPIGYAQPHRGHYRSGESHNGFAIAGFVLSLVAPLFGLIFSWIALSGMGRTGNREGYGMAKAGLIISIVFLSVGGLTLIVFLIRLLFFFRQ